MLLSFHRDAARLVASIIGVLLLMVASLEPAAAAPARLGVSVGGNSVRIGSTTPVILTFLDSSFKSVDNDRPRTVLFEIRSTRGASEGKGDLASTRATVPGGTRSYPATRFSARAAGTVLIRATSDGLAPGEALVRVSSGTAAVLDLLFPVVHAQESRSFELLPSEQEIPLNGLSTAQFSISLGQPAPAGQSIDYRVVTDPPVSIQFDDRKSMGVVIIKVKGGQYLSDPFLVLPPARPGGIAVRAQALPDGPIQEAKVKFVAPEPKHVGIETRKGTIDPHERVMPLQIQLLDADRIPMKALVAQYEIELQSDPDSGRFEPRAITLSSARITGISELYVPSVRFGGVMNVLARWKDAGGIGQFTDIAQAEVDVTAAVAALLSLAILGGFLGGVASHLYRGGPAHLWPTRTKARFEPGLVGNALLSALSGLVLYQAFDVGLLHRVESLATIHGSVAMAFVLGVTGGFAGVAVFEVLTDQMLPGKAGGQPSS